MCRSPGEADIIADTSRIAEMTGHGPAGGAQPELERVAAASGATSSQTSNGIAENTHGGISGNIAGEPAGGSPPGPGCVAAASGAPFPRTVAGIAQNASGGIAGDTTQPMLALMLPAWRV